MPIDPQMDTASSRYDEAYYRNHCGHIPYERNTYWLEFFHGIAEHIVRSLKPRRVLDAGCAKGFLVEALWERGVQAWGIDFSEYAIGEVRKDMKPYCRLASLAEPIEGRFDLVTCIEVLEHMPDEEARAAMRNLTGATAAILFSSTPTDLTEPTHVNVQPTIGWLHQFAEHGFAPDLLFDAGFIAPHAFLLRRVDQRLPEDVLVLFAEIVRYRLILADRHRQIEHLNNEAPRLQSGKAAAEAEVATLNHELHLLRVERHQQEQELAARVAEIANLTHLSERAYADRTRELEAANERAARLEAELRAQREAAAQQAQREAAVQQAQREVAQQAQREAAQQAQREAVQQAQREAVQQAQREIDSAIATLTKYADSLQINSERLGLRVSAVETRLAEVGHQTLQILQSRIWRTLCAGGAIVLSPWSFFRSLSGTGSRTLPPDRLAPPAASDRDFRGLVCDEPRPDDDYPRTEKIPVHGWVLAESGVERLEVGLPGVAAGARMGVARPDVARSFPGVPGSRTCGFTAEIDTSAVPDGLHILHVKAFSRGGAVREIQVPVRIDHQAGYASDYDRWIAEFENRNESFLQLKLRALSVKPLISILVPVYRTPIDVLRRTIESVLGQSYPHWQLCMADDGSHSPEIERLLDAYAAKDERIRVKYLAANQGISHASNAALELAEGNFVALLDHDDELAQDALYYVAEAINLRPDADLLYSDEDKIDSRGRRYDPFFKPDWSPDLLLSENYLCHLLVVRRSLLNQAGGFQSDFDGSQDYDLVLRLTGIGGNILHIPRVLYHWRSLPASTASASSQKPYTVDAAQRAMQREMDRRSGSAAQVVPGSIAGRWRVRYPLNRDLQVSVIIAAGGNVEVLRNNLEALFAKTEYGHYEVVVIDNSRSPEIQKLVRKWPDPRRPLRYLDWRNKPFNYSQINNEAVRHCQSPLLLFLNDDTTAIAPGWLEAMVELAARPEVGAVGAKLLYPDGRIQHAGVVMGLFDNCGHAFKGLPGDRQHYFDLPDVIRNVSAVTGACLMVRATVFAEAGGFDEQTFAVAFNDIDLCLKIGQKGYRVLYTPHALLYHHEAFSKTTKDLVPHPDEVRAMQAKWKDVIAADPFYSPNLTRTSEDYSLRRKA
jgi:GT2 family glycosyltransferase/SAM-dependent methyltransferase